MKHNITETIQVPLEDVAGYILLRSPTEKFKFNVMAIDNEGDFLFVAASDLTFEKASAMVEVVNREHFPVVPSPTELVTIQMDNEQRIFKVVKD